jgi:hypothetical protein
MARLPSSRHAVHRSLRILDLREGEDSPLRTFLHHGLPATCRSRRLPTQRLRPCGLNGIFQTRSQQCTGISSSQLLGPCHDVHAVPLHSYEMRDAEIYDAVVLEHVRVTSSRRAGKAACSPFRCCTGAARRARRQALRGQRRIVQCVSSACSCPPFARPTIRRAAGTAAPGMTEALERRARVPIASARANVIQFLPEVLPVPYQ